VYEHSPARINTTLSLLFYSHLSLFIAFLSDLMRFLSLSFANICFSLCALAPSLNSHIGSSFKRSDSRIISFVFSL
jgi:hypothetical protein